ncbi:MAG: PAS domain-containing protein [Thermodesulfobacteriota bacterium]
MAPVSSDPADLARRAIDALLSGGMPDPVPLSTEVDDGLSALLQSLNELIEKFHEAREFITALSAGHLEKEPPLRNYLISPFKQLHSRLAHLTWQTMQVARGDLNQRVDFLGEFSTAFNSMIRSLQEKRRLEKALEQSERRLALALDGAALGLWDVDLDSSSVVFNSRWAEMLGYLPDELEPRISSWFDRIHPDDRPEFDREWHTHLAGLTPNMKSEHRVLAKSGTYRWILSLGRIVDRNEDGKPLRMAGTFLDITDRKSAEQELVKAHALLLEANTNILDSIHYARTIQTASLPLHQEIEPYLADYFVLWKPRDVIGGDFYKFRPVPEGFLAAVMDCTGHGVPGAIITMIAGSCFDRAVEEVGHEDPAGILHRLDTLVKLALSQHRQESLADDGLDIGICSVNRTQGRLLYAGARIDLYCARHTDVDEIRADPQSIGYKSSNRRIAFRNHEIPLDANTVLYLVTDGITSQPGGLKGLPMGRSRFTQLLRECCGQPLRDQRRFLEDSVRQYRGQIPQLDDMTLLAFIP